MGGEVVGDLDRLVGSGLCVGCLLYGGEVCVSRALIILWACGWRGLSYGAEVCVSRALIILRACVWPVYHMVQRLFLIQI